MQALVILAIVIVSICQQNYTLYKSIDNPNSTYDMVVISNDMTIALFYTQTSTTTAPFSALNWTSLTSTFYSEFPFPPTSMETYADFQNQNILLYTSS